jgi:hypothetical protein
MSYMEVMSSICGVVVTLKPLDMYFFLILYHTPSPKFVKLRLNPDFRH